MTAETDINFFRRLSTSRKTLSGSALAVLLSLIGLVLTDNSDLRYVMAPALVSINIVLYLVLKLWDYDRTFPLFDAGIVCAVTTLIYTIIPLISYIGAGLVFIVGNDSRLVLHQPTPFDLGTFHWRHVLYIFSFVIAYSLTRNGSPAGQRPVQIPWASTRQAIFILFFMGTLYVFSLQIFAGYKISPSYEEMRSAYASGTVVQLPLFFRQITHYITGMLLIFKLAMLIIVFSRFDNVKWRIFLYLWLTAEIFISVSRMGQRSGIILLLLATGLLYHRIVRPLRFRSIILGSTLLLVFFFTFGVLRSANLDLLSIPENIFSISNECQSLLGTAYDLHQRVNHQSLQVPWQIHLSEFLALIPQQVCPVDKIPPGEWYLSLLGLRGSGVGYTFGVLSQSIVGLDWLGLALRGAMLGLLLAQVHKWYMRNSYSFFATLFYLWLCIKVYYTFRGSTFYLLPLIIYEVIPAILMIKLFSIKRPVYIDNPKTTKEALQNR